MIIERTKNTGRNVLWGMTNQVIMLLLPFLIRTIILRVLGTEYLGLSSLFTSILQVLNLSELGFSTAVVYSLYKPIADDDKPTICAILRFYKRIYKIVGTVILLCGLCLLPFLRFLINGSAPDGINIQILFVIYLLNASVGYLFFAYQECLILAHQRNDLSSKRSIITRLFLYGVQIVLLLIFKNYYLYAIILPVSTILDNIIIHFTVKKYYPQYKEAGDLSEEIKNRIKKQVTGLLITRIAATTRNSFDNIIISSFLGLALVGTYGNYYYIMSSVQAIMIILVNSMQAGVGNSIASESLEKNFFDFRKISFLYSWVTCIATVCMMFIFQPFMRVWAGEDSILSTSIVILIVIYFYLLAMGDVPSIYINATGIWWQYRIKAMVESLSNLVLNIVLVKYLGLYGVILATVITRLLFGIIWGNEILFKNYFGHKNAIPFYKDHIGYVVLTLISCGLVYIIGVITHADFNNMNIIKLISCVVVPIILFCVCYYRTRLFKESSKHFIQLAKLVKERK